MGEIAILLSNGQVDLGALAAEPSRREYAVEPGRTAPDWSRADLFGAVPADLFSGQDLPPHSSSNMPQWLRAMTQGRFVGDEPSGAVALWLVLANAVPGKDAEFEDWYDNRHIHDSVAVPGFISGQRYRIIPPASSVPPWRYLTVYQIALDQVGESLAEAGRRAGTERMPNPGYLAPGPCTLTLRPID